MLTGAPFWILCRAQSQACQMLMLMLLVVSVVLAQYHHIHVAISNCETGFCLHLSHDYEMQWIHVLSTRTSHYTVLLKHVRTLLLYCSAAHHLKRSASPIPYLNIY